MADKRGVGRVRRENARGVMVTCAWQTVAIAYRHSQVCPNTPITPQYNLVNITGCATNSEQDHTSGSLRVRAVQTFTAIIVKTYYILHAHCSVQLITGTHC